MLVIACAGVLGWLTLGITLCLGAAAKRGDELELGVQRYLDAAETPRLRRRRRRCSH